MGNSKIQFQADKMNIASVLLSLALLGQAAFSAPIDKNVLEDAPTEELRAYRELLEGMAALEKDLIEAKPDAREEEFMPMARVEEEQPLPEVKEEEVMPMAKVEEEKPLPEVKE